MPLISGYIEHLRVKAQDLTRRAVDDFHDYGKVPKFSDARKLCYNLPKIQTKKPNLRVYRQKDANGMANSVDPDQTAPLEAV